VTYTVTGNSGKTRSYTVTVISSQSSTNDITRFTFPDISTETIIGAVPDEDGSYPVSVWVPGGTDLADLGVPNITYTGLSISSEGGSPGDFGGPKTYTVTAEDGGVKTYKVTVSPRSEDAKIITSLIFEEVPVAGGSLRVVASINQDDHTITAEVPFSANTGSLKPTLTYIGKSVAGPSGGGKTANPFTDTPRDFTAGQTYTVTDQNGEEQSYTVRVIRKSSVEVSFTGEADAAIIADSVINQDTGVMTITLNTAAVAGPYEWYLNGVKQPVPSTQDTLTLNVGDGTFIPGRHEIVVSGRKNGLHYTGKVYFMVGGDTK
jgi:hypothetical protein